MSVKMKLLRPWPVGDVTHRPGQVIEVSAERAKRMESTNPPWAERVKASDVRPEEVVTMASAAPAKGKDAGG